MKKRKVPISHRIFGVIFAFVAVNFICAAIMIMMLDYKDKLWGLLAFGIVLLIFAVALACGRMTSFKGIKGKRKKKVYDEEAERKKWRVKNIETGKVEYNWQYRETWEDYCGPYENLMHVYCEVKVDGIENVLYYRTRNLELKVGDAVYVPVGYKYKKRRGVIVSMEEYFENEVPYPVEYTKYIKGKADK